MENKTAKIEISSEDIEELSDVILLKIDDLMKSLPSEISEMKVFEENVINLMKNNLKEKHRCCLNELVNGKKELLGLFASRLKNYISVTIRGKRRIFKKKTIEEPPSKSAEDEKTGKYEAEGETPPRSEFNQPIESYHNNRLTAREVEGRRPSDSENNDEKTRPTTGQIPAEFPVDSELMLQKNETGIANFDFKRKNNVITKKNQAIEANKESNMSDFDTSSSDEEHFLKKEKSEKKMKNRGNDLLVLEKMLEKNSIISTLERRLKEKEQDNENLLRTVNNMEIEKQKNEKQIESLNERIQFLENENQEKLKKIDEQIEKYETEQRNIQNWKLETESLVVEMNKKLIEKKTNNEQKIAELNDQIMKYETERENFQNWKLETEILFIKLNKQLIEKINENKLYQMLLNETKINPKNSGKNLK